MKLAAKKDQLPSLWSRDADGYRIQPSTEEIVEGIRLRGGRLLLDDNYELHAWLPKKNRKRLQELLRDCHARVFQYLLERRPKTEVPAACRCDEKPYPHLRHEGGLKGDEQPEIRVSGNLKQLNQALAQCRDQGESWTMDELIERIKQAGKRGSE